MSELEKSSIFEVLEDEVLEEFSNKFQQVELEEGETLFERNEPGDQLYAIEEGLLKVSVDDPISERNKTLAILGPGEVVGEMAILTDQNRSGRCTALRESKLQSIEETDFLDLLEQYPEMGLNLIKVLSKRLLMSDREIQNVTFNTIPGRLAAQLLNLSERFGEEVDGNFEIKIDLTHERLAELVGTNRETVTRHLNRFEKNGNIEMDDQRITITDSKSLERLM